MKSEKQKQLKTRPSAIAQRARPPVVAIMGHIDHGKSTLLDYIRKSNVVDKEAGGITQRISAYEVLHKDEEGKERKITFLDTPGHEAFSKMRERGAQVADIAVLIVSAEDGVKPQTIEAWQTIKASKVPTVVAINKIDKEGANLEKTKADLAEHEIFLENYGGNIPFVPISAKTGKGVDELLNLIHILADMEDFQGDLNKCATGFVIEADLDPKRGIQATLVVKDGILKSGMKISCGESFANTRIMEDFRGKKIKEATFSSPIRVVGFDKMPKAGEAWRAFDEKEEALACCKEYMEENAGNTQAEEIEEEKKVIPIVLKADSVGSIEAIEREIQKITSDSACFKIISSAAGPITEGDIKYLEEGSDAMVIGFNVSADNVATDLAHRKGVVISFFDVIYKMTEWLESEMERLRPRIDAEETTGKTKILKTFSHTKDKQVLGGRVLEGVMKSGENVKIMRRDFEVGKGRIVNLQKNKEKVSTVEDGVEFGLMVQTKIEIVPGDVLESFKKIQK